MNLFKIGVKMKFKAHIIVTGRVQGVYFRGNTRKEALKYNVNGWVRNLPDGRVEAIFEVEENRSRQKRSFCGVKIKDFDRFSELSKSEISNARTQCVRRPQKSPIFEGKKENVDKLINIVREGPSHANVTDLDVEWFDYTGEFTDFRIIY
jgi:acylphosphatase